MTNWLMHDSDGNVRRMGCGNDSDIAQLDTGGLTLLTGQAVDDRSYVLAGAVLRYSDEEWAAKIAPHDLSSTWSNAAMSWVDTRVLEDIRIAQWSLLKASRDAAEFGTFVWGGSTFDSNEQAQSRIQGAAQLAMLAKMAGQPFSVDWTLANNSVRPLSLEDMLAVGEALGAHIIQVHETGRRLRDSLDAATTKEQVLALAWPV